MAPIYDLAYWLHVISYLSWIIAFAGSLLFGIKIYFEQDANQRRKWMEAERRTTSIGAHFGVVGILISGIIMSSFPWGPRWGWFNIQLYPWLVLKQILFILILVLIGFSIKRNMAFRRAKTEISKLWGRAYRMSMVVYILVVISTILGLSKPGITTF